MFFGLIKKIDFVKIKKDLEYKYIKLSPYKLLIGYDYKYQPIVIDMKVTPHLGVVGISNNGKSKCIELALKNLRGADIHLINCMDNDFFEEYTMTSPKHFNIKLKFLQTASKKSLSALLYVSFYIPFLLLCNSNNYFENHSY